MNELTTRATRGLRARYGDWAVVTGASDGIGRAFARALARAGFHLVLVARRGPVLDVLATELADAHQIQTRVLPADLATADGVRAVIDGTRTLDVGVLVAAAGFGTSGRFIDGALDEDLAMIDVNCRAVAALAHHFGRRFAERKRGALILMSSLLAFQGVPRAANYAATKAYVQSLAEGLRGELRPLGVDVIASAPGPIASGFAQRAAMTMSMSGRTDAVAEETLHALGHSDTVRPGLLSKLLELSLSILPRWGRVRVLARVMAGMTKQRPA